jgi:hypothetical protein
LTAYPVDLREHEFGWTVEQYNSYSPTGPQRPPSTFEAYCALLEEWESELLTHVHLLFTPFQIVDMLTNDTFVACSDGSAIEFQGTYGWVLSLHDGTRLAHGAGPVNGHDPRSFRAEGQGMLSLVCLLRRLAQWTATDVGFSGILATDNSGLVARVKAQSAVKYPVPNATFKPDWDVVQAIVETVRSFPLNADYQHVSGHQDKHKPKHKLDLLGQLNVEADDYAGQYLVSNGAYRPIIPLSPTRPVGFDLDGKTVHRSLKQAIREALHGYHLLEEMQLRYDWPDGCIDTIDWDAHRLATQSQNRRIHYVKLCHELLPTGRLISLYTEGTPDYCHLCRTPDETFHHILKCRHPSRTKWRTDFLSNLRKHCVKLRTDPELRTILCEGLRCWLEDVPFEESHYPANFQRLLAEQKTIGWGQVFQGRISLDWALNQQYYYNWIPKVKGEDGPNWSKSILQFIFSQWNILWDTRNKEIHGKDDATRAIARNTQAHRELAVLYSMRDKVLHRDQHLFYTSLDDHLEQPTRSIRQWINTYKPLLLQSRKDAEDNSLLHVRTLDHYFD